MLRRIISICIIFMLIAATGAPAEKALPDEWDSVARLAGSEDIYLISRDGLWGMARRSGEILIEPQMRSEPRFENGYAVVSRPDTLKREGVSDEDEYGSLYGLISAEGEIVIPLEYDDITIRDGFPLVQAALNGRFAFMNFEGEDLTGMKYTGVNTLAEGYVRVGVPHEDSGMRWGVLNSFGEEILPCEFFSIDLIDGEAMRIGVLRSYSDAVAAYELRGGRAVNLSGESGDGDDLLDKWDRISRAPGAEGVYLVCLNDQWGMVTREGETLIEPRLRYEPEFEDGYAVAAIRSDRFSGDSSFPDEYASVYGVINVRGEIVIPIEYDSVTLDARAGIAMVEIGDEIGYMNLQGETLIEPRYYRAQMFVGDYAAVALELDLGDDNRDSMGTTTCWGVIDRQGREIIPFDYDMVEVSENGLFHVRLNGKSGFMNADGEAVTEMKYTTANPFVGGYAPVAMQIELTRKQQDSSEPVAYIWGAIDESGREAISCQYDSLQICENGLALVSLNEKYGYLRMDGSWMAEIQYDRAQPFVGSYAAVAVYLPETEGASGRLLGWGVIDAEGNVILPMEYSDLTIREDGAIEALAPGGRRLFEIQNGRTVEIPAE